MSKTPPVTSGSPLRSRGQPGLAQTFPAMLRDRKSGNARTKPMLHLRSSGGWRYQPSAETARRTVVRPAVASMPGPREYVCVDPQLHDGEEPDEREWLQAACPHCGGHAPGALPVRQYPQTRNPGTVRSRIDLNVSRVRRCAQAGQVRYCRRASVKPQQLIYASILSRNRPGIPPSWPRNQRSVHHHMDMQPTARPFVALHGVASCRVLLNPQEACA